MNVEEIFSILEIELTKDENIIKQAYRDKLSKTNPEDDPEGFKRLRQAYEAACEYARSSDETEKEADTTPSGEWVSRASDIYNNIKQRTDVKAWEQLFEDELFMSIEGEEECREKLLVYMMDHIYFPTDVWKLLDEKLHIREGFKDLKEKFPVDFLNYLNHKCSRGEDVEFSFFEGPDDGQYDLFLQKYNQAWRALDDNDDLAMAKQILNEIEMLNVTHPVKELVRANIFLKEEKNNEALECMKKSYEKFPDDLTTAFNYGQYAWKFGDKDVAAQVFIKIKEKNEEHYMSNFFLTEWYFDRKEYEQAKKCAEKVMAVGGSDEFYELTGKINSELEKDYLRRYKENGDIEAATELSWCHLQDGNYFAGIKLAKELDGRIEEKEIAAYHGLLTKLYLEEADYELCIEYADKWRKLLAEKMKSEEGKELEDDKHRMYQTYAIKANAYHMMGYQHKECFDKAIAEIDAYIALDDDEKPSQDKDISIYHEKAQILLDADRVDESIEIATNLVEEKQAYSAYAILLDAYAKKLDAGNVVRCGRECINVFPQYAHAYEQVAKVFLDLDYKDDLKSLLDEARENKIESVILDAYEYCSQNEIPENNNIRTKLDEFDKNYKSKAIREHRKEYYEKGFPVFTQMLYEFVSNYMLNERGRFSMDTKHFEEAKKDFYKILERTPNEQFALNNLGCIYKYTEKYEAAIVCFKKAIRYMDEEPNIFPYGNLGHTYERMGEYALAAQVYTAGKNRIKSADNLETANDLIVDYARSHQMDKCMEVINEKWGDCVTKFNAYEYYDKLLDAYDNADDLVSYERTLVQYKESISKIADVKMRNKQMTEYKNSQAFFDLIMGRYQDALEGYQRIEESLGTNINDLKPSSVYENLIITLSFYPYASKKGLVNMDKSFAGIFKGLLGGKFNYEAKLSEYGNKLQKAINDEYTKNDADPYFYKEKLGAWKKFLIAYAKGEDVQSLERIAEEMKGCIMCRYCAYPSCNEYKCALAMIHMKKGEIQEAIKVYEDLQEEQPYEWYSKAGLKYLKN